MFLLFIFFVYWEGNVGNWVCDVMLLCMVLLFVDVRLGVYIVEEIDFCFVSNIFVLLFCLIFGSKSYCNIMKCF